MERIGIIGHFGGDKEFFDGQTVKTKNVERLILESGEYEVYRVDTYLNKTNRIKLFFRALGCFFKCKKIIFMLSTSGVKVMYPMFRFLTKFSKRKMYNAVIGSEILTTLKENPKHFKNLQMFKYIWYETKNGVQEIASYGLDNVKTVPNFKYITPITQEETSEYIQPKVFNFCTFSRVMEEKGITDAIDSIESINQKYGKVASLDIYGQVEKKYKEKFDELLEKYSDFVSYKGCVDSAKSVETIKNYYGLLFPTRYEGEGFPGTVLDAFASAVPIVSRRWNAMSDIIDDKKCGLVYPTDDYYDLTSSIEWSINNPKDFISMRGNCLAEYQKYAPSTVGKIILDDLRD